MSKNHFLYKHVKTKKHQLYVFLNGTDMTYFD
jgi:hypothetical protein